MQNGFFLITGASRGIGEALARRLLGEGHTVLGVSRSRSERLTSGRYAHLSFDLTETSKFARIMDEVEEVINGQTFDFLCLVNNASAIEPIGPIEDCPPGEIQAHLKIGLLAPAILTSMFVGRFSGTHARKKIAFISSGSAFSPMPDSSVYCTSKAGLHMFAQSVGLEQTDVQGGFEVISIGPGMVDTAMQSMARAKSIEEYAMADFFKLAYAEGKLQDPDFVAEKIYIILRNRYEQGVYVSVSEV